MKQQEEKSFKKETLGLSLDFLQIPVVQKHLQIPLVPKSQMIFYRLCINCYNEITYIYIATV